MSPQTLDSAIEMNLNVLENQRQIILSQVKSNCLKYIATPILILGASIFAYREKLLLLNKEYDGAPLYVLLFLLFFIALAMAIFFYSKGRQKFEAIYKAKLVKPLMEKLYPNLTYTPKGYVAENHFQRSRLFNQRYTHYKGDDYFNGQIDNVDVEFSELIVIRAKNNETGGGSQSKDNSAIFSGLFLHTKLEKAVSSQIILDPMMLFLENLKIPSFFLGIIKSFLPDYGNVVKTGNNDFDSNFKLHCDNEEEAKRVMNPEFIHKIMEIAGKLKEINLVRINKNADPVSMLSNGVFLKLSIIDDSLYFAIFGNKFFDVKFSKSAMESKQSIMHSITYINMLIDIVKAA